ncbi:uncharacterized protein FIBRA_05037 [Fibroporia radiculosa]|uniref:Uncharacterized protein n=1 Tax=Fibroporia radiculosa TaxID=599839 RepID=J4G8E2_9APHY|nr:uncharacterized protein FIBRA_05037 [Fibroporia radiculosa]CCM02923.1 predicted protein [Fibroporia radiculosa]
MVHHVAIQRSPIVTPVQHAHTTGAVEGVGVDFVDFEGGVSPAEGGLNEIAETVLDVVLHTATGDEADAYDVETMQLVDHANLESAICGANLGEAVGGKECAPLVVVVQQPVRRAILMHVRDRWEMDGELCGEVVADVAWGGSAALKIRAPEIRRYTQRPIMSKYELLGQDEFTADTPVAEKPVVHKAPSRFPLAASPLTVIIILSLILAANIACWVYTTREVNTIVRALHAAHLDLTDTRELPRSRSEGGFWELY